MQRHNGFLQDGAVGDRLDVPMHDADVLDEIEMTSNLMIAASEADGPLPQTMIDTILGLSTKVA